MSLSQIFLWFYRVTEGLFTKIITNEWLNDKKKKNSDDRVPLRMLIDEFLDVPHKCPFIRDDTVNILFILYHYYYIILFRDHMVIILFLLIY